MAAGGTRGQDSRMDKANAAKLETHGVRARGMNEGVVELGWVDRNNDESCRDTRATERSRVE